MKNQIVEQEILYNLVKITEQFPQYTMSQHLLHFLRTKGDADPYHWDNTKLLVKIQEYYDELTNELANDSQS